MNQPPTDLDVVVLGGGGHVGLPLSLAFAQAGLRVGIYDSNQATLDRIAAGEMPFMENGADELLREVLATGRLAFGADGSMIARTDQLVVVIGTPVDEFLGPSMTIFEKAVDQIAPHLRDGALVALRSTVYPGTTGYVALHLAERGCRVDVAFCPERIAEGHALEELHTLPQIIGADDDRAAERATALFGTLAGKTIRTTTKEAELTKLFTNTWRYMKFAVANQFFTIAHSAGVDYNERAAGDPRGLPAGRATCRARASRPARACSRTRCSCRRSRPTTSRSARPRCRSTRACRPTSSPRSSAATTGCHGKTVGILGMAFKSESDDPRASLSYKLRKLLSWAGARVLATDPYVEDERLATLDCVVQESDILILGAPHKALPQPGRRRQGRGRRVGGPRRGDQAVVRILVTGAAGFINGYLVPELLEAGHEVIGLDDFSKYGRLVKSYDGHARYRFVEGDAKDAGAHRRARRRLRPGRRRGRHDRRDQLLPRVRLRPAGRERADPRLDLRRRDQRPTATGISSGSSSSAARWSTSPRPSSRHPRAPS